MINPPRQCRFGLSSHPKIFLLIFRRNRPPLASRGATAAHTSFRALASRQLHMLTSDFPELRAQGVGVASRISDVVI